MGRNPMAWILGFDPRLEGSIPSALALSVVTSGRRLVLETRICRFEAGRSDQYGENSVVVTSFAVNKLSRVRFPPLSPQNKIEII